MTHIELRKIRTLAGLSQRELAELIRISPQTIRNWESRPGDAHHRPIPAWAERLFRVDPELSGIIEARAAFKRAVRKDASARTVESRPAPQPAPQPAPPPSADELLREKLSKLRSIAGSPT